MLFLIVYWITRNYILGNWEKYAYQLQDRTMGMLALQGAIQNRLNLCT